MAHAIYLVDVLGTGTQADAFRPDVPAGISFACLMIHEVKKKALIVTGADNLPVKAGRTRLFNGLDINDLKNKARTTNPTASQRDALNAWLTANGWQAVPTAPYDAGDKNPDGTVKLRPAPVSWLEVVDFVANQVNPGANLTGAYV